MVQLTQRPEFPRCPHPLPSSAPSVGRFTGFALGFIAFLCLTMIGGAGYVKSRLDQAELVMTAPASALYGEGGNIDTLRRMLGYGGFLGAAQDFAASRDAAKLAEMRDDLKQAGDAVQGFAAASSADAQQNMRAILDAFAAVGARAEKSAADPATPFALADLAPLYAALPTLDARAAEAVAPARLAAAQQARFWGMLLTLLSWCSLVVASALTAGLYLALRTRNSAPLRALAQSVKNLAQGDMRTPVWGMERSDMVGELARTFDMARYQFSQLPDMTLLSEQGPVRLRFEGNTRSMFEAMMRVISRDSQQVHEQAEALNGAVARQQETLALLVSRVEAVLRNVETRAVTGDQQVRQALSGMLSSAEGLKNAQAHAADQLNRIVPYMQDRARGLSEITQLTGKQVAQVLQSLILTERGLRGSASASEEAIRKLSASADNLGERLFGAVNLLQASGKVLAETTEKTQGKLDEAIQTIGKAAGPAESAIDADLAPRLESVASRLGALLAEQSDFMTRHSNGLVTQSATVSSTLAEAADQMRVQQTLLDEAIGKIAGSLNELGEKAGRQSSADGDAARQTPADTQRQMAEILSQVSAVSAKIEALSAGQDAATGEPAFVGALLQEIRSGFEGVERGLQRAREDAAAPPSDLSGQMRDQWYQMAAQIEATRSGLAQIITQQADRIEERLGNLAAVPEAPAADMDAAQQEMEQQTQILSELVATLGVLDAHMQEIRTQVAEIRRAG